MDIYTASSVRGERKGYKLINVVELPPSSSSGAVVIIHIGKHCHPASRMGLALFTPFMLVIHILMMHVNHTVTRPHG